MAFFRLAVFIKFSKPNQRMHPVILAKVVVNELNLGCILEACCCFNHSALCLTNEYFSPLLGAVVQEVSANLSFLDESFGSLSRVIV